MQENKEGENDTHFFNKTFNSDAERQREERSPFNNAVSWNLILFNTQI